MSVGRLVLLFESHLPRPLYPGVHGTACVSNEDRATNQVTHLQWIRALEQSRKKAVLVTYSCICQGQVLASALTTREKREDKQEQEEERMRMEG